MSWTNLPTNFTDLIWQGLKKFRQYNNEDQTISFEDVTEYSGTNTSLSASQLNQMTGAINDMMNGEVFYTEDEVDTIVSNLRTDLETELDDTPQLAEAYDGTQTYQAGDVVIYEGNLSRVTSETLSSYYVQIHPEEMTSSGHAVQGDYVTYDGDLYIFTRVTGWSGETPQVWINYFLQTGAIEQVTTSAYDPEATYTAGDVVTYQNGYYIYTPEGTEYPRYNFETITVNDLLEEKEDSLTFDNAPTSGSDNPVKSGGVYSALADKANTSDLGTLAGKNKVDWDTDIDDIPSTFPPSTHNHDERYYTKTEVGTLLRWVDETVVAFHNSVPRGKDITSYLTDGSLWDRIKGTNGYDLFEDLYLGDYITAGGQNYMIVDFDYYWRTGDSHDLNVHHLVMMPTERMSIPSGTVLYNTDATATPVTLEYINTANYRAYTGDDTVSVSSQETDVVKKWNGTIADPNTNTTAGGYKYSRMRQVVMKAADTIVRTAFGADHVKAIDVIYPNPADASASGTPSSWAWFKSTAWTADDRMSICDLPNELQIYGQYVWGNRAYEIGIDKWQFSLFRYDRSKVNIRASWWLRSVHSATTAAYVTSSGGAYSNGSSNAFGVRPRFLLVG